MKRRKVERKTVWIANTDEAIQKRIKWMQSRGWELEGARWFSSGKEQISLVFRKPVK